MVRTATSRPLKVGLIGAGGISQHHLPAYRRFQASVILRAVCDIKLEAATHLVSAAGLNDIHIFQDPFNMISHGDIDAVDICVPHHLHAPIALAALESGKHVLVEKPMACSMDECLAMVTAAERSGLTLMVAQNRRFIPEYRAVRNLVRSQGLGRIRAVRFDAMQNLATFVARNHWMFDGQQAGGGVIMSVAVHQIDLMRYIIGEYKQVKGASLTTSDPFSNGAEDYASASFEFRNGAIGELFSTYSGFRMPWGEQFMIFGDDGAIHSVPAPGRYIGTAKLSRRPIATGETWEERQYSGFSEIPGTRDGDLIGDSFTSEILHFVDCCCAGHEPVCSGADNLGTMEMVFAIYESARKNQPVELGLALLARERAG